MSKPSDTTRSLLHRLGVAGAARVRACKGTGALLVALGVLAFAPGAALANSTHAVDKAFGEKGSGAGQMELTSDSGVAVNDETHDVYVADTGNHRVDEFEADGTFVRAWGWGVGTGLGGFETCTEVLGCKVGVAGTGAGQFEAPAYVAVDNGGVGDPSKGDVYVADVGTSLVQKFTPDGVVIGSWQTGGELSVPGIKGIATDASGDLWTYGIPRGDVLQEFDREGVLLQEKSNTRGSDSEAPGGLAVNNAGDIYLLSTDAEGPNGVLEITPGGEEHELPVGEPMLFASGLAVDQATNELYVGRDGVAIESLTPTGAAIGAFGSQQLSAGGGAGLAVDSSNGVVYEANASADELEAYVLALEVNPNPGSASGVTATTATLNGVVDPEGSPVHECKFEYGTSSEYQATGEYEHSTPCLDEAGEPVQAGRPLTGSAPVSVHADLKGLLIGTIYDFRLVAVHENPVTHETTSVNGDHEAFTTPPGPVIVGGEAKEVTASAWDLTATVNPEGLPVTRCTFEYVPAEQYEAEASNPYANGHVVKCEQKLAQIGTGTEPVPVSAQITGLSPNVTYHWRLTARDENGEALGIDHTFVYPVAGAELPDHRAYEMVTPPFKNGALFGSDFFGLPPSISEDGSRVIALTIQCFTPAESCNVADGTTAGVPFAFTRTSAGWEATSLAPSSTQYSESAWSFFDANEDDALYSMPTGPAGEDEWYLRQPVGSFVPIGPANPPEVTGTVPTRFSAKAATADLSHLVWGGHDESHQYWPFDSTTGSDSIYEYVGSHNEKPFLVGVTGGPGSTELISSCGTSLGGTDSTDSSGSYDDALSGNGRTVYFTAEPQQKENGTIIGACPLGVGANENIPVPVKELYARVDGEEAGAHTVAISEPLAPETLAWTPADENCTEECEKNITDPANWSGAEFQNASEDGSKVLFTSSQQLTNNATQGANNLYMYDFDQPSGHNWIDVSAPEASGENPRVQGVTALSADGSHVYFVAQGVLTVTPNRQGQSARPGRDNLYLYQRDAQYPEGHTTFIVSLLPNDGNPNSGLGYVDWSEHGESIGNVTPDGQFLVFESVGDLTPDTHSDGGSQVFRYDALSEELVRLSIGNDGFDDNGNIGADTKIVRPKRFYPGPVRRDPTMSNDGSFVFFESPAALTPRALNYVVAAQNELGPGNVKPIYARNVYEWHEGHVYLISDGHDVSSANTEPACGTGAAVCLLGADATGHNVFFTTADRLVPKDTDTQVDIYDARICEPENGNPCVAEPSPALPPCDGESCHGIPAATPSLLAPGSATFNGEGNITPTPPPPAVVKKKAAKCKKVVVKNKGMKKTECIKRKKAKKAAKRASDDRRTK